MSPASAISAASVRVRQDTVKRRNMASRRGVRYDPTRRTFALREGRLAEFLAIHQSDASLLGCLLRRLREAGRLDDHDVDAETAARSLAAAVGEAERAFEQMGQQLPPLALVATNGRVIAGLRRGHPLQIGVVDGLIPCARCEIGN